MTFTVRPARVDDIHEICSLGQEFIEETHLANHVRFNQEFPDQFRFAIQNNPNFVCLVACLPDETIIGYVLLVRSKEFFVGLRGDQDYLGEIYQFYVLPRYRRSRAIVNLRDAADEFCRNWECFGCQAGSASGINDNAVLKLWGKIGYTRIGSILFKRF